MNTLFSGEYHVHHGDCITHMATMPPACVDFSVFSPPFPALYAYTSSASDLGNSENLKHEGKLHFSFFFRQFARVLKPGRAVVVHCMQLPRMKRTGEVGLFDFRGLLIRLGERAGLVYEYDWLIRKNPQGQAIRTKSREMQFAGLESDRARCRGALGDYLIKFRAPGVNDTPIRSRGQVSRNDWIAWAEAAWMDIDESDTLNKAEGRGEDDTRHICPLQIPVIRRCVKLFSEPGEVVFSPFTGIGSEGYVAVSEGRRFYGCELKDEYHATALRNLSRGMNERVSERETSLFAEEARP